MGELCSPGHKHGRAAVHPLRYYAVGCLTISIRRSAEYSVEQIFVRDDKATSVVESRPQVKMSPNYRTPLILDKDIF